MTSSASTPSTRTPSLEATSFTPKQKTFSKEFPLTSHNSQPGQNSSSTKTSGTGGNPSPEASRLRSLIHASALEANSTVSFNITQPMSSPSSTTKPNDQSRALKRITRPSSVGTAPLLPNLTGTSTDGSQKDSSTTSMRTESRSTPTTWSNASRNGSRLETFTSTLFPNSTFKNAVLWCSASFAAGILSVCFLAIPLPNGNTLSEPPNASSTGW